MKRAFDIVVSALALLLLSPVLIPVMVALRFTGEGEIFYSQERIGRGGKPFRILKFATMLKASPNLPGGDITIGRDPRILPMGGFLRKTKINELPQLFNILIGDMSVIGPRPQTPRIAAMFPDVHWRAIRNLRPGLSGIGSVIFHDEENLLDGVQDRTSVYASAIVPYKVALEKWYADHQGLWTDLKLVLLTVVAILHFKLGPAQIFRNLPAEPEPLVALRQAHLLRTSRSTREETLTPGVGGKRPEAM